MIRKAENVKKHENRVEENNKPTKYEYVIGFDNYTGEVVTPQTCNSKIQDKNEIDYTGLVCSFYSRKLNKHNL